MGGVVDGTALAGVSATSMGKHESWLSTPQLSGATSMASVISMGGSGGGVLPLLSVLITHWTRAAHVVECCCVLLLPFIHE